MILNNFLQNIAFSHQDFELTPNFAALNIVKRLTFEEDPPSESIDTLPKPSIDPPSNPFNQKRIRPFHLGSEEDMDNSMELSERSSMTPNFKGKRLCGKRQNSVDLEGIGKLKGYIFSFLYKIWAKREIIIIFCFD